MSIYLPIAELSVNIFWLLALGGIVGVLSGMFGVGGGFLTTPFLMFMGISPAVAVASSANQIVAASVSGFFVHAKRQNVDFRMGMLLLIGGLIGSSAGVGIFGWLKSLGAIDLVISLLYVTLLSVMGGIMAWESYRSLYGKRPALATASGKISARQTFLQKLPWQVDFPHSRLRLSAWLPIALGLVVGILVSVMGVGGGFFMIPVMIYLLGMPTSIVVGTSLFQIIFTTINVTILHAVTTQTVDIVLAAILLIGSTIGAQIGSRLGGKIAAAKLRGLLALLVLAVAFRLMLDLFTPPADFYEIMTEYRL
jgi:uncharacterized membrane protein YfcA